ncbi:MAG: hypothetical protein ACRENA_14485 [Vulcanimicrobiaceae bacterium]
MDARVTEESISYLKLHDVSAAIGATFFFLSIVLASPHTAVKSDTLNPRAMKWLLNGPAVAEFAKDPESRRFFENAEPFVIERKGDARQLPQSWRAVSVRAFPSYRAIERALENGSVDSNARAILYDNEGWKFTPEEEQRNPAQYMKMAAELVHRKGLMFIATPAVTLVRRLARPSEKRYDAYLRLGIAADAARYADVIDIQAQGSEKNVRLFSNFVQRASEQARAANPNVVVLAGISTNPNGQHVTAEELQRAIVATRRYVDGYWLNVPSPSEYCPGCNDFRPDTAIDVLRRLRTSVR